MEEYGDVDRWIEILKECQQLPEQDVKKLTEKVWIKRIAFYLLFY